MKTDHERHNMENVNISTLHSGSNRRIRSCRNCKAKISESKVETSSFTVRKCQIFCEIKEIAVE